MVGRNVTSGPQDACTSACPHPMLSLTLRLRSCHSFLGHTLSFHNAEFVGTSSDTKWLSPAIAGRPSCCWDCWLLPFSFNQAYHRKEFQVAVHSK